MIFGDENNVEVAEEAKIEGEETNGEGATDGEEKAEGEGEGEEKSE